MKNSLKNGRWIEAPSDSSARNPAREDRDAPALISRLRHYWQGPAVRVLLSGQSYQLGEGEAAAEVVIRKPSLLAKLWHSPCCTFGEAFARGDIEVRGSMKKLMDAIYRTRPEDLAPWRYRLISWLSHLSATIPLKRAIANARHHYDIGTDFYRLWLDPSLTYSCAYFLRETDDLATAQSQKLELLCRKARLAEGQTLLDIGCGWGSLLVHAARYHGVQAVGVTPSVEQANYVEQLVRKEGLADRIRVLRVGWREIRGKFDRIISVGMFEHVGLKQYREFFRRWRELLANDGLSVLHCIGRIQPAATDPWVDKYIFPDGYLPTMAQIARYSAAAELGIVDVENLWQHYARTLEFWLANYLAQYDIVAASRGAEFARMWSLYLHGSQAGFRCGALQLWQTVLAKGPNPPWPLNRQVDVRELSMASSREDHS